MKGKQIASLIFAATLILVTYYGQSLASESTLRSMEEEFTRIVDQVSPAIVEITATKRNLIERQQSDPFESVFFPHLKETTPYRVSENVGTGIIFDKNGYIVTTESVVGKADKVIVTLSDGRMLDAEIVGADPATDIALVRVDAKDLPTASPGDSENIRAGSWIITIGHSYGSSPTLSFGIVSGAEPLPGAPAYYDAIKLNAAVSPGNSGGAVIDMDGKLVGIIAAFLAEPRAIDFGYPEGKIPAKQTIQPRIARFFGRQEESFAIPISFAKVVIDDLMDDGKVERGWLGVFIRPVTHPDIEAFGLDRLSGNVVTKIVPTGPAGMAGIRKNDVIVSFDGKEAKWRGGSASNLVRMVSATKPQTEVELIIVRDKQKQAIAVKIGEMPEK